MNQLIERMVRDIREEAMTERNQYFYLSTIIFYQEREALEFYIGQGFSMNPRNEFLLTPAFSIGRCELSLIDYLVEKGMNLHVLDVNGRNILSKVAIEGSPEVARYLLNKGVNPYEKDFLGQSFAKKEKSRLQICLNEDFVYEYSYLKEETYEFENAALTNNFPLALSIVEKTIERLGGLTKLVYNEVPTNGYKILIQYHDALILNKRYEDATRVLDFTNMVYEDFRFYEAHNMTINTAATLFTRNAKVARSISRHNQNSTKTIQQALTILNSYVLLSEIEDSTTPRSNNLLRTGRGAVQFLGVDSTVGRILNPIFIDTESYDSTYVTEIFEDIEGVNKKKQLNFLFATGLTCLYKKDYVSAELVFRKIIDLCIEVKYAIPDVFAQSHALIDYIQSEQLIGRV